MRGPCLRAPGIHRNERALLPLEVLRIHFREMRPLLRQIIQREDGRNRADWHACTTIHALDWAGIHAVSLVPMQGSAIRYAIFPSLILRSHAVGARTTFLVRQHIWRA